MIQLGAPYEYNRECWCFRTIARMFSRSSSVSRAPKLGMSARTCSMMMGRQNTGRKNRKRRRLLRLAYQIAR